MSGERSKTKLTIEQRDALVARVVLSETDPRNLNALKPHRVAAEVAKLIGKADEHQATEVRRKAVEVLTGVEMPHIGGENIDMNDVENDGLTIGRVEVPVKDVGKIRINGQWAHGEFHVFVAQTEGLVGAGLARGIETFNMAGGITTIIKKDGMTRDVLIALDSIADAQALRAYIKSPAGQKFIFEEFGKRTQHGRLVDAEPYTTGSNVHLRFRAASGAANGMNMVTDIGKQVVQELIKKVAETPELGVTGTLDLLTNSGNMCTDKKAAFINMLEGRGLSIETEAFLPAELIKLRFFKNSTRFATPLAAAKRLVRVNQEKNERGTIDAGSLYGNTHIANILNGIYTAYGQDVAQIVEGSMVNVRMELTEDDSSVHVHATFPALELATYKGETGWGGQKELLQATGVWGEGDDTGITRHRFGEIVAGMALAGDVNLTAVQAAGELGIAKALRKPSVISA